MEPAFLIEQCLKGSRKHQRLLFDQYYKMAYNIAYRYLNNVQDTEDAVITAFNDVFKNLSRFELKEKNSLRNWILTISTNSALKSLKSKKRISFIEDNIESIQEDNYDSYESETQINRVQEILKTMPDGYRVIFIMHVLEGYRHQEIADFLNIGVNTSKSQLSKAKAYIRNRLNTIEA